MSLTLIATLSGALLLAMFFATASAQGDNVIGRGFTGVVMANDFRNGFLMVESKGAVFQLTITDDTVVSNPPDRDIGLEGMPAGDGFRIAGLVSGPITDDSGILTSETLTAGKITLIPGKATRRHKWTIAVDKQGDDLTTLDENGVTTDLPGLGTGFEKGDRIIMLVQSSSREGIGDSVRALFRADIVGDRLVRLAAAQADDPERTAALAELRTLREDAETQRLQNAVDNAGTDFRDFVVETVRVLQGGPPSIDPELNDPVVEQTISDCARSSDCPATADKTVTVVEEPPVIRITSPSSGTVVLANDVVTVTAEAKSVATLVPVTFNVAGSDLQPLLRSLTEEPYTVAVTVPTGVASVEIKVTAVDANGSAGTDSITLMVDRGIDVGVKITSPVADLVTVSDGENSRVSTVSGSNEAIAEGDTILIRGEVTGTGAITVVFAVNGVDQPSLTEPPYSMRYFLPLNATAGKPAALEITATATDGSGNTATDTVTIAVVRKTDQVNVRITTPSADLGINSGDTITIRAETDNNSEIAFVTFSVGGVETITTSAPYTHTYVLPSIASATAAAPTNSPPNAFVGNATLDGLPALDDTVVIAWIDGKNATTLTITVTATANSGITGSATLVLQVSGPMNVGEAKVEDGVYALKATQPVGQSFNGKTVTFTVGGKAARQTATWNKGDATVLNLTAN